jgi:hypothetical protein
MQNNSTSVLDRTEAAQVSPVIQGPAWFDIEPGAWTVRMHVPLTPAQMAAALFFESLDDFMNPTEVWGSIACVVAVGGIPEIERREADVAKIEADPNADPNDLAFLAKARALVAMLTGSPVPAGPAAHRAVTRQVAA